MLALQRARKKLNSKNKVSSPQQDGRNAIPFKSNLKFILLN